MLFPRGWYGLTTTLLKILFALIFTVVIWCCDVELKLIQYDRYGNIFPFRLFVNNLHISLYCVNTYND